MKVVVNGECMELSEGADVAGLLAVLGLEKRRVAVELGRKILSPDAYASTKINEGDVLEIVGFVGGG